MIEHIKMPKLLDPYCFWLFDMSKSFCATMNGIHNLLYSFSMRMKVFVKYAIDLVAVLQGTRF